jgi:hypothetical protein
MTVLLFVTHFFKRKNTYSFLFSSAISEGIKDTFKEMGYSLNGVNKKENRKDQPSQNGQGYTKIKSSHG